MKESIYSMKDASKAIDLLEAELRQQKETLFRIQLRLTELEKKVEELWKLKEK